MSLNVREEGGTEEINWQSQHRDVFKPWNRISTPQPPGKWTEKRANA